MLRILNGLRCVLPAAGLFIAGTLWIAWVLGDSIPCGGENLCSHVLASKLSSVGGIPLSAFGTCAYVLLIVAAALASSASSDVTARRWFTLGYVISGLGTAISFGLTAYSVFGLHATCSWCIASAIVMAATFGLHAWIAAGSEPEKVVRRPGVLPIIGGGCALSLVFLAVFATRLRSEAEDSGLNLAALQRLSDKELVPTDAHSWGSPQPNYDLVFIGDLECPTCHVWFPKARDIVLHTGGRIIYRHCPLSIHPLAATAALICEEAGVHGKFRDAIEYAYAADFDKNRLARMKEDFEDRTCERIARMRLKEDESIDAKLGITHTPTMVLVFHDGRREPVSLAELERRISHAGSAARS